MNGLKEHKYMDFLTTIGYIVFALCCVIGFFAHLYILFAVGFVLIFVLRLIGYSLDRFDGSLTVVSNFSLTKSLKTLIISMLLSFFIVKFAKINVLIWANVCYNRHRR